MLKEVRESASTITVEGPGPELQWLKDRLARQERGIAVLRDLLKEEAIQRENAVRERDRIFNELDGQISARDTLIRDLHRDLQGLNLQTQLAERDQHIHDLQAELQNIQLSRQLQAQIEQRDQAICELQIQLNERDQHIRGLQAEIESIHLSKLWPFVRLLGVIRQFLDTFRSPSQSKTI